MGLSLVAVQDSQQKGVVPIPWTTADAVLAYMDAELQQKDAMLLTLQQWIPGLEGEVRHLIPLSCRQQLACTTRRMGDGRELLCRSASPAAVG